ncbi:MAG: hypothetical protein N3D85_07560 [Candidatus Bathyarchaeota archaeon]|nr:hypothetical protein [Candidatus Bathyarchaeota archaeon]
MSTKNLSNSKKVAVMAITATLYATFFFISGLIAVPQFTLLYLPIILLGVFPLWFGLNGLVGSMIGAFIGGAFVEGLGFFSWIESVTTLIIYVLVWLLIPRNAGEIRSPKNLLLLAGVYAVTLLAGTTYILWQFTTFGLLPPELAQLILWPTFTLNIIIEIAVCPILLRTLTPKMRNWGFYSGSFLEWRSKKAKAKL